LYDAISKSYTLRTANFGPANRPRIYPGTGIRPESTEASGDDLSNPITACDMFDEDCTAVFASEDEE